MKKGFRLNSISQVISIVITAFVITVFLIATISFKDSGRNLYTKTIEETVKKYLIQCYATEGSYPPDLDYLSDNYGLILDYDNYIYHYFPFSSNILPEVRVYTKDKGNREQIIF